MSIEEMKKGIAEDRRRGMTWEAIGEKWNLPQVIVAKLKEMYV